MIIYNGDMDKVAYKNVMGETIASICEQDKDVIYLDADVMNSAGTYDFWQKNPERAINAGIAEANMAGMAGGLSAAGKKPYTHTFGPFATRRCYDQLFISIAYAGNSACVIGSDAGVCAAFNGGTHMPFEDMALIRAIPSSTVIEISDAALMKNVLPMLKDRKGLTYVRTTRKTYPKLYSEDTKFTVGKGEIVREGKDIAIIACGLMVGEALLAADTLAKEGIQARVVDMFTVKPVDDALVADCAKQCGAILTTENHNVVGGLGDAVASSLIENNTLVPMKKHGVVESFGQVGPQDYLQEVFGLTGDGIVKKAKEVLANK